MTQNGADIDTRDARMNATVEQYSWDNSTGTKVMVSEDIRQGVHTVEYDIYVDPTSSTPVSLKLPFQYYFNDRGNNLEPTAYIRWYDWATDVNNNRLTMVGSYLQDLTETNQGASVSRGFFLLNNQKKGIEPNHALVGVPFNPNGLSELVTIACDVSKYYDGIYEGSANDTRTGFEGLKNPYLMHEPTLSTRYIFNIRPAMVIASNIRIGQQKLEAAGTDMFPLAEDNGRVSLAMKDANTTFSIRASLYDLNEYYIYNGSSLMSCSKIAWYAYLEDETCIYRNDTKLALTETTDEQRISRVKVSDLNGTYTHITSGASKSVTAQVGQRYHLVGYVGNGNVMAPVVHYEVNLVDAPAYTIDELPLERTEAYLREHMDLQATVDFDGLGGTDISSSLTLQSENHSTVPMAWHEAEYGFCYPDVRRIWCNAGNDYMLLRSMNRSGVSETATYDYYYHWWAGSELYDYTFFNGLGLDGHGSRGEFGSFLYVDASDESRTIAKMGFTANLCAGSELCFMGFIANMTGGTVQPQVMSTVYAVKTNGDSVRVVSFHSSNLSTMTVSAYTTGTWYQVYGRIAIPTNVDLTNVDHYEVDIDNYAPGTEGADYAVDQLQFYTSKAKLKVKQQDVDCGDASVKVNVFIYADGVKSNDGVHFDYFLGTLDEFSAYSLTDNSSILLSDALEDYRGKNGGVTTYQTQTTVVAAYASTHADYAAVISQAIDEGKLLLAASSTFSHTITGNPDGKAYIAALPIEDVVNNGTSDFHICSPLEFVFTVDASGNAPTLVLGFEDVAGYPDAVRVVCVGKEQLDNMQRADGYVLTLSMMVDGATVAVDPGAGSRPATLLLTASSANGSFTASVQVAAAASADYVGSEDMEALFDSNLSSVPTVYTVAGSKAVSIDVRPALDMVAFGVSCADAEEPVTVTLETGAGAELAGTLYVVDALTGERSEVTPGATISVQPNDYGRYFLVGSEANVPGGLADVAVEGAVVVSAGHGQLTVRSAEPIGSLRVTTLAGATAYSAAGLGHEAPAVVAGGVYLVEVVTATQRKTMKVSVEYGLLWREKH